MCWTNIVIIFYMKGTGTIFLLPIVFMHPINNFSNSWDPVNKFRVSIQTEKSPHHSISNIILDFHNKVDGIRVVLADSLLSSMSIF